MAPPPPTTAPTLPPKLSNRTCDSMLWRILKLTICILLLQWTTRTGSIAIAMSPGAVTPKVIKIGIGDNANITCTIFESEIGNSSLLWFKEVNRENKTKDSTRKILQPSEDITILNASTVVINIRNAFEFVGVYECMRGDNLIGTTELQVGTPPKMVEDFVCLVDNYEKMQCNFTPPENKILTKYSLLYKVNDTLSEKLNNCNLTECNNSQLCCKFEPGTMYNPSHKVYKIKLTGTNALGVTSKIIYVNCTEIVVPAAVTKVNISNITTDSVTFSWTIINFGPYKWKGNGLEYEIQLNSFNWSSTIPEWRNCNSSCSVSWYHLPYAFYEYSYTIRAKATTTKNQKSMWSPPYAGTFKTKSRPPQRSPETAASAFYTKARETRLYWQALAEYEKNGPQFEYIIECPNGTLLRTENTSISVSAPSTQSDSYYIHARNAVGDSSSPTMIRVFPAGGCGDSADPKLIAIIYENYTYKLSWWLRPNATGDVKNYTVFWCQAKALSSTECEGDINFKIFNSSIHNFTVPSQHHRLNLAVAANYTNCSTGMQWIKCEALASSELGKLEPVLKPLNGRAIEISWSLEGVCPSILAGYNISYCQVSKNDNLTLQQPQNCISQMVTKTLNLSNSEQVLKMYTIGKLKPFSKYRIEMYMFSQNKTGAVSAPLFAETKEAAPSAPTDLKVSSATHNSVYISWQRPEFANGILRSYKVHAINKTKDSPSDIPLKPVEMGQVLTNDSDGHIPTFFQLTNLMSYSEYTIYVTACTGNEFASAPSNAINISTSIGTPTNPRDVNSKDDGDYRILSWYKPMHAAGRVEFYEIVMWIKHKDMETGKYTEEKKMTLVAGERTCRYKAPECSDPSYTFSIEVRAVNVATKEEIQQSVLGTSPTPSPARRRRHTSPEINSIVMSGIQNYNHSDVDTDRDSRAEFEGAKTTTMPTVPNYYGQSGKPAERDDDYVIDNSFKCENLAYTEAHNSTYVEHMLSHKQQKSKKTSLVFFHSPWQKASVQISCSESSPQLSGALIMLGLSIVAVLSLFVSHHVWKKLNKMKNIEAVLPEGLVDHLPNYKFEIGDGFAGFGDIGNAVLEKQIIIDGNTSMSRNKNNCLMFEYNREAHHLLPGAHNSPANAHDSLTASSSSSKGSCDERMEQLESHSYEDAFNEEQSSTRSADTLELNDVTSSALNRAATVALNTRPITACDYEVEAVDTTPGGYVTPSAMLICAGNTAPRRDTGPLMANTMSTTQTSPSGYVAPQALAMLSSPDILQQQRQPVPNNAAVVAGYTTLDALTSPTTISTTHINVPTQTAISLDPNPAGDDEPHEPLQLILPTNKNTEADVAAAIAYEILNNNNNNSNNKLSNGYVTQRQLSELGQLLH